jgi:hypothetical protein
VWPVKWAGYWSFNSNNAPPQSGHVEGNGVPMTLSRLVCVCEDDGVLIAQRLGGPDIASCKCLEQRWHLIERCDVVYLHVGECPQGLLSPWASSTSCTIASPPQSLMASRPAVRRPACP